MFSLKAENAPLPVWVCADINHWLHGQGSFKFCKEGGVERRDGKKQVEVGISSTLISSVCISGYIYSHLKHSELSMTVPAW